MLKKIVRIWPTFEFLNTDVFIAKSNLYLQNAFICKSDIVKKDLKIYKKINKITSDKFKRVLIIKYL